MLLVDKPVGVTSFDVVKHIRKLSGVRKVGHAGTLDPLASGLMIILVGKKETSQAQSFLGLDKVYEVTIRVGEKRDTGDLEGRVIEYADNIPYISHETFYCALKKIRGLLKLPVPMYSAIKVNGHRLYKQARKGHLITLPIKDMMVHNAVLRDIREIVLWRNDGTVNSRGYEIDITFEVSSGVYVRSLSEEFGKILGYPATTSAIRRTKIGKFDIKDSVKLDMLTSKSFK